MFHRVRADVSRRAWLQGASAAAMGLLTRARPLSAADDFKVVLVMTGSVTDGGWNGLAYDGLKALIAGGGIKGAYAENVAQAQIPQVVRGYAEDGYDLVLGHGFEFGSALTDIAPDYPHAKFFATTFKPAGEAPKNLEFVDLAYVEVAYGAGALAALVSVKKSVGFVGGGDNPTQQRMMRAFIAGAERTVPGSVAKGIVTGDYNNPAKGKEAASAMIGNGADVIWHAADITGLGAIRAAAERKVTVIGSYSDQTDTAPEFMATSFALNLPGVVAHVTRSAQDGSFIGGGEWKPAVTEAWTLRAGANGDHNPKLVADAAWASFKTVWADLGTGRLDARVLVP